MKYWHLQMHPSDSAKFDKKVLIRILTEKKVIGMGESWLDKNKNEVADPLYFKRDIMEGDIVLIRDGISPIALVKVKKPWYIEKNTDKDLDWFTLRRPIDVLKIYVKNDEKLLKSVLEKYGNNHIQAPGTLTLCIGNNATNEFIKKWYLQIQKETVMSKIKLDQSRIESINQLWFDYKARYSTRDIAKLELDIAKLQQDWKLYKNKIVSNTLTLDEYTNRKENISVSLPGYYLCNFLERETRDIYGSSKPGNANNFEIKLNEDGETYTFRDNLKSGDKKINYNTKEVATNRFNEEIKPLFTDIVNAQLALDKISIVENSNYAAKQILRKIAVLDANNDFLYMYSDEAINTLHNEFLESETSSNLGKNHEVRIVANEILNLEDTALNAVLISRFLWEYATSKAVADENTPNVILYGPPGTGKTYTVKQSLDFICLGDTKRYAFVTFHPSFTYEDFIDGIKPKGVTKDGNIKFELVDGVFKKFCKTAKAECEQAKKERREPKPYYFVVDEINRASLSAVFGETLMCLEKDYRYNVNFPTQNLYKTQYSPLIESMVEDAKENGKDLSHLAFHFNDDGAYFGVPNNVFFIGMMNDVDKSIDAFDLALRRRFKWIRMDYEQDVLEQKTKFRNGDVFENMPAYANACTKLNEFISEELGLGKSYEFGHSFFMKITGIANSKTITHKNLETLFQLYLQPSLKEYLRALFPEQELDSKIESALVLFKENLK